jgi:hypothetical protein
MLYKNSVHIPLSHYAIFFILLILVNPGNLLGQQSEKIPVWNNNIPFPSEDNLSYPAGTTDVMVHRAGSDSLSFLHDAAIVAHNNVLFAAWYNCPSGEMEGASLIRGRRSADGGLTWSEPEVIASDQEKKGIMYVPVTFLSWKGALYAFVANMEGGADRVTRCEIFKLNEENNTWNSSGFITGPFIPNCPPVRMSNNNFIMAGRMAENPGELPVIPAIAVSEGENLTKTWKVIPLKYNNKLPDGEQPDFPETTVIVDKQHITSFVRNHSKCPILFKSDDFGQTWSDPMIHNFPFASSKIFAGTLSTNQDYVIANLASEGYRNLLVIAVTRPGEKQFSKLWKIRNGYSERLNAGPEWSYPSATEYNGKLFIVYTSEKHHCCLTIIPLKSLTADN